MKKPFLILLLAILCLNAISQKHQIKSQSNTKIFDPNKFTGIGIFKIGMDTSIMLQYAFANFKFVKDCEDISSYMDYRAQDFDGLLILKKNYGSLYNAGTTTDDPEVNEYLIGKYTVSGITLEHLRLKFYKGKLVKLTCDESLDLVDGLTQKYGEPVKTDKEIKCDCLYNATGIIRTLVEHSYFQTWYNGQIIAFDFMGETYDQHCKTVPSLYFDYGIPTPEIDKWEKTESFNAKQLNKPKPNLKDL